MPKQESPRTCIDVSLERSFEQLCGFASGIRDLPPEVSLVDLFTPDLIRGFATCLKTERGCKRTSIVGRIGRMVNALRLSPSFEDLDLDWVHDVLREFRIEDPEELRSRRRTKEVGYDRLSSMLKQMSSERRALKEPSAKELAWRFSDELLILWLTTLPPPPRCIREARVLGATPNIFNEPAPDIDPTGIPPWAVAEHHQNPASTFWQFRFDASETPNAREEYGFVPRRLILLLDEYVTVHRMHLVQGSDPGTLFLDRFGGMMSASSLMQRVGILTERYLQKKVTPEACRAIYGYWWLDGHPGDYDGLAGLLWIDPVSARSRFDPNYRSGRPRS